jgi:hypothetical protein
MAKAGVLLDGAGLQPSSLGARVQFHGGRRAVIDGPFAETKELIAGYWMIEVKSKAEAIEWAKRCPLPSSAAAAEIELRQVFESAECPADQLATKGVTTEYTEVTEGRKETANERE